MRRGVSHLEVMVSLAVLCAFLLATMALYGNSVRESRRCQFTTTAAWLARGRLVVCADEPEAKPLEAGRFPAPHEAFTWRLTRAPLTGDPALQLVAVQVTGPDDIRITLQRLQALQAGEEFDRPGGEVK